MRRLDGPLRTKALIGSGESSLRIPGEAGQGFRREGGHLSGVKAATCGWSLEGSPASIGRVAAFRSERATSWAPTLWRWRRGSRGAQGSRRGCLPGAVRR